jgi:hypothetical protein
MKNYEAQFWYFEILEMVRKLLMTSVVTFIAPGSPTQITFALIVTFFYVVLTSYTKPFVDDAIGSMQLYSLVAHCTTLLYGILLAIDEISDLKQAVTTDVMKKAFGIILVVQNTLIIFFPALSSAWTFVEMIWVNSGNGNDSSADKGIVSLSRKVSKSAASFFSENTFNSCLLPAPTSEMNPSGNACRQAEKWSKSVLQSPRLKTTEQVLPVRSQEVVNDYVQPDMYLSQQTVSPPVPVSHQTSATDKDRHIRNSIHGDICILSASPASGEHNDDTSTAPFITLKNRFYPVSGNLSDAPQGQVTGSEILLETSDQRMLGEGPIEHELEPTIPAPIQSVRHRPY